MAEVVQREGEDEAIQKPRLSEQWGRCCQKRNMIFKTYGLEEAYQCGPEQ